MTTAESRFFTGRTWWPIAIVFFAAFHLLLTYSSWKDPLYRVPGPVGDNTVMLWNIGWVKYALDHHSLGGWFPTAYYPEGFFFLYGTHTWLDGLFYWIFSPILPKGFQGAILWANITMLLATVTSGLALISALRAWAIRSWPVLLLVSSAVVFSWFRFFALRGHYHFFGTEWMLVTLCVLSWARVASLQNHQRLAITRTIAAGLLLGITFLNDQTMMVFASCIGAMIIFSSALAGRPKPAQFFRDTVLFYGCSLITASIHLVPTIIAAFQGKIHYEVDKAAPRLVDGSSLVLPPTLSFLGSQIKGWREWHRLGFAEGTYLGIIPLALLGLCGLACLIYLFQRRRSRGMRLVFWATAAAALFLLFVLGDRLMVGRHLLFTMPGRLLKEIPLLNNIRLPQRWVWPAHLCIALAGATLLVRGLSWAHLRRHTWPQWLILTCAIIPPLEAINYPPEPPVDFRNDEFVHPPGIVEAVQDAYTDGAVLMMPAEMAYAHGDIFQFLWGYDIPMTIVYTARMPVLPSELPWREFHWNPETGDWLRNKQVKILVFPFHTGKIEEYQPWINEAKKAVPGLIAFNKYGEQI